MAILDLQRRQLRLGAIRLGQKETKTTQSGKQISFPAKLDTFRVTSPHKEAILAVAEKYGGTMNPWQGPKGPEFEVITTVRELPVLIPKQHIDPNYELWGRNLRQRICDGAVEKLRGQPCLCERYDNHNHTWYKGTCQICHLDQKWTGEPHNHQFVSGECAICGCGRACKPTTRVNVMIQGIPGTGVYKLESHGFNAACELPALAEMISQTPVPLPATLGMRHEDQSRIVIDPKTGHETTQTRKFWVPEIRFPWILPELLFADSIQLEAAARDSISGTPVLKALGAKPSDEIAQPTMTIEDAISTVESALTLDQVRALWADAKTAGILNPELERILADRATEIARSEVIEAELIEP